MTDLAPAEAVGELGGRPQGDAGRRQPLQVGEVREAHDLILLVVQERLVRDAVHLGHVHVRKSARVHLACRSQL